MQRKISLFYTLVLGLLFPLIGLDAQADRWQQRVQYQMFVDFDTKVHQFTGEQRLTYSNNSPDTLHTVFYHLYLNAFQPNSDMDVRSRWISDPDARVRDRIQNIKPGEEGYTRVLKLNQNGIPATFHIEGTILEVTLPEPILPGQSTLLDMRFESQVPIQIRRNGRNSKEGIAYSMAQWYPKLCEYDYQGWHANPYIGREFYGVWGDFDVKIAIDCDYILGGTGYIQNPEEVGYGYGSSPKKGKAKNGKITWHFFAPNVHDFMWAADPDYTHVSLERPDGLTLHFLYQKNDTTEKNWAKLPEVMSAAFDYINDRFGKYPYKQYSFIQGGDGGMEYPMGTLITGNRTMGSLTGVSVHELMHSWYQMLLGTNESLYAWMDEGFTEYATNETENHLRTLGLMEEAPKGFAHEGAYTGYFGLVRSGKEEPASIHADHFQTNSAYSRAAYNKGNVFQEQLNYVIGKEAFNRGLLRYYYTWRYKHPNVNDYIRIMEKESGMELDWYKEYMVNTTHTIDYAVDSVGQSGNTARIHLSRLQAFPMPVDLQLTWSDGSTSWYTIPLDLMRAEKKQEGNTLYTVLPDWHWVQTRYIANIPTQGKTLKEVKLDPSMRLADVNRGNNKRE